MNDNPFESPHAPQLVVPQDRYGRIIFLGQSFCVSMALLLVVFFILTSKMVPPNSSNELVKAVRFSLTTARDILQMFILASCLLSIRECIEMKFRELCIPEKSEEE